MSAALSAGLLSIANGFIEAALALGSPIAILVVLRLIARAWIAAVLIEQRDRQGYKPTMPERG